LTMDVKDFDYELPEELIAQDPLEDRSASRLMVLDRETGEIQHRIFKDITEYLRPGDCLVINDTKVIPARLFGVKKDTGAKIEILLLKRRENDIWETLVRPGKKAKPGTVIEFGEGLLTGTVVDTVDDGNRLIQFHYTGIFEEILDQLGQHFTQELLAEIEGMGVKIAHVTLHVGLGTFRPVKVENVQDHHMHSEFYIVEESEAKKVNDTRAAGGRVICVGTTSCRTVESASTEEGVLKAGTGWTEIFIYPGYRFKVLDALITNFHLPQSTLVMLVSALAGREHILDAYREAVKEGYRFFSFGDAMFIAAHPAAEKR